MNNKHRIYFREGVSSTNPVGDRWIHIHGSLKQIDSGLFGIVYGVNVHNDVFCMAGITEAKPSGMEFQYVEIGHKFKYVSCGGFGCWAIKPDNSTSFRTAVTAENCMGNSWLNVDGNFIQLDSGLTGSVYAISHEHELYTRLGICAANPTGEKWAKMQEGKFKHVTVGYANLIALAENGTIILFE